MGKDSEEESESESNSVSRKAARSSLLEECTGESLATLIFTTTKANSKVRDRLKP